MTPRVKRDMALFTFAWALTFLSRGIETAVTIPMIATTINSSASV